MFGAAGLAARERAAENFERALEPFATGGCPDPQNLRDLIVREAVRAVEFEHDGLLDSPTANEWRVRMRAFLEFLTAHEVTGSS